MNSVVTNVFVCCEVITKRNFKVLDSDFCWSRELNFCWSWDDPRQTIGTNKGNPYCFYKIIDTTLIFFCFVQSSLSPSLLLSSRSYLSRLRDSSGVSFSNSFASSSPRNAMWSSCVLWTWPLWTLCSEWPSTRPNSNELKSRKTTSAFIFRSRCPCGVITCRGCSLPFYHHC